jgi:tetratricopeptide (TPR) repeat protein
VKDREPDILQPVIEHHHADCLSLVSLYKRLCHLVEADETPFGEERAHWLNDLGNAEAALQEYERLEQPTKRALMRQALLLKRTGQMEQALPLFEQVGTVEALVELAKYAEHREKDINRAIIYTEQAIALAERKETVLRQTALTEMRALRHRMNRLERKQS